MQKRQCCQFNASSKEGRVKALTWSILHWCVLHLNKRHLLESRWRVLLSNWRWRYRSRRQIIHKAEQVVLGRWGVARGRRGSGDRGSSESRSPVGVRECWRGGGL
jgi:hypothetical protein